MLLFSQLCVRSEPPWKAHFLRQFRFLSHVVLRPFASSLWCHYIPDVVPIGFRVVLSVSVCFLPVVATCVGLPGL